MVRTKTLEKGCPGVKDKLLVGVKIAQLRIRNACLHVRDLALYDQEVLSGQFPGGFAAEQLGARMSKMDAELTDFIVDKEIGTQALRTVLRAKQEGSGWQV